MTATKTDPVEAAAPGEPFAPRLVAEEPPVEDQPAEEPLAEALLAEQLIVEELLIEEISIDGMCGVY